MGWLKRLFGMEKPPAQASVSPAPAAPASTPGAAPTTDETIAPERRGLTGEYDESGLAKRVAFAFDQDAELTDIPSVDVLQTGSTVVLRGLVPNQTLLSKLITIAGSVSGATQVDSSGLAVGIPPERVGLNGEYDESGLAKRVVQALQEDASVSSAAPFDISQTISTVVVRGKVPSQEILDKIVAIAKGVSGTTAVKTDEVNIG